MNKENDNRAELLRRVKNDVVSFESSPLHEERIKNNAFPVIGEGSHYAKIMFIGEAPGRNEAKTGRPFCGAAGKILDELLASINIPRAEVYITNIVKDRPPMNRDPLPEEIEAYAPFLNRQIEIIMPKIIVTLGRFSMSYIIQKFGLQKEPGSIGRLHGKVFETEMSYGKIKVIPFYHPAAAIYNQTKKDTLKKDFEILKQQ